MWIVAAGSLLVSGLLCTWIALQFLIQMDTPPLRTAPIAPVPEPEDQPKLTRLGRPIEVKRLG
jgi:hypothetical protein